MVEKELTLKEKIDYERFRQVIRSSSGRVRLEPDILHIYTYKEKTGFVSEGNEYGNEFKEVFFRGPPSKIKVMLYEKKMGFFKKQMIILNIPLEYAQNGNNSRYMRLEDAEVSSFKVIGDPESLDKLLKDLSRRLRI